MEAPAVCSLWCVRRLPTLNIGPGRSVGTAIAAEKAATPLSGVPEARLLRHCTTYGC